MKVLKVTDQTDLEKLRRLLVKEVVGWKWLRHENILPFLGVLSKPPSFSIVSERMDNENIMNFVRARPNFNRLCLLVGAVAGLEYLHEHGIVHGDLKGVNILVDSEYRARLADFGLAVVIDESITGGTAESRAKRGTYRWMAPELMDPGEFGFTGELLKELPSMSTDVYAIGMTIYEVLTGRHPFHEFLNTYAVIYKVIKGDRPGRPPGIPNKLWELLMETWIAEPAGNPRKRPSTSAILHRLKGCVDYWGKSIVPLVPEQWQESATNSDSTSLTEMNATRLLSNGPHDASLPPTLFRQRQDNPTQSCFTQGHK
ncbi:kinase-like protein [Thelephora ganbajun]|uniref:Kinase-like protein n=1 Tax=Thelephora ganbajun TaxID=370292 RepID=A0ACB6ZER3_THEGA|nr:kinase-like protein [Thelephora ganbajun]